MCRHLCSLYLIQRNVNDGVRFSAASNAAASVKNGEVEFIRGQPPSHKLAGPKYLVIAPDPCEDPERVYIDVVVKKTRQPTEEWCKLFDKLKQLGPWRCGSGDEDEGTEEKHRRAAMEKLSFVGRLDPAAVDLPKWQEPNNEFARRLTLRHLCHIILNSNIVKSKKDFFNAIFETPWEVASAGNARGLANRARFTQESLINWFFSFDTYSKCIIFLEVVIRYLDAQATPVSLSLDDIYCDVFTQIIRQTYITRINNSAASPEKSLAPTPDTRLLPVTDCIKNFLMQSVEVTDFSFTGREYRFATTINNTSLPPAAETNMESIKRIFSRGGQETTSEEEEEEEKEEEYKNKRSVKRKAVPYRGPFRKKNKRKTDDGAMMYSMIDGYKEERISPLIVYIRNEPLVPSAHNHLLFPVFADEKPGSEILFFMHLKLFSAASLLLPGLFKNKNQYLCGDCKWMNKNSKEEEEETWKYSLADYCPLKYCTEEISLQQKKLGIGTTISSLTRLDVQPLYF
uniref:Wsv415-like protein n=1 Tax=Sesarmops intermedium nimavirus TaxID=2133796 RepID=A0A401IPS2_9VIRU|nr:MAG: wsv415-like protein [Sesarmops intermedium nimavirus]GBG35618.1 wsv415-like protein [Sesarmops intermedium nimavirus]